MEDEEPSRRTAWISIGNSPRVSGLFRGGRSTRRQRALNLHRCTHWRNLRTRAAAASEWCPTARIQSIGTESFRLLYCSYRWYSWQGKKRTQAKAINSVCIRGQRADTKFKGTQVIVTVFFYGTWARSFEIIRRHPKIIANPSNRE